jgi:cytochrome P450
MWEGWFPEAQVRAALEHGPIYKWIVEGGYDPGEYVYMVGPEANRFVLHTGREHFSHDLGWTPIIGRDFGKGLLNMDPPEHTRHRRMWNPAFTRAFIESYLPVIQRVIAARTSTWAERGEVDVYAEAREITFDAAAAALAGFEPGPQVDELRRLFYVLLHGFEPDDETFEEFQERVEQARVELAATLRRLIVQRRAMPEDEEPRDVLGMIVRARDEDGRPLSDEQLLGHVNILLVAGHETTTTLSAWVLYLLATMPDWRARLLAELDAAPGTASGILPVETLRELPLLDSFIKETGRLYPPVLNVPRGVLSPFEFGGYEIPAGTPVRLALGAGHLLPGVFDAPDAFLILRSHDVLP